MSNDFFSSLEVDLFQPYMFDGFKIFFRTSDNGLEFDYGRKCVGKTIAFAHGYSPILNRDNLFLDSMTSRFSFSYNKKNENENMLESFWRRCWPCLRNLMDL